MRSTRKTQKGAPSIAIVGMACRFPDANSPAELWENVLAQRRAFRRLPPERLNFEDYFSPDPATLDRTYTMEAAVIRDYEFDRVRFRVSGPMYRTADLAHWLALDVASEALADAGFRDGRGLPRERTSVLIGNTLTGEFSRAAIMRLRWPYVRRVVEARLSAEGWEPERLRRFLRELETLYKAPFEPVGDESLAGGLSNTIAGRICNAYDLKGGGYTVDGACSSSLLAVATACAGIVSGDVDVALAGGVDLSLDPFEVVGFAKIGALARDEMRLYDERSEGFWPGEGCGVVVLMPHEDAVAQGRRIYATICGWGVSSDGSGGITRPEVEGQNLAVERAYRRAGFGVESVAYFEGHGTGTTVGDATELRAISTLRRSAGATVPAAIGSIKANIGHTKAAAGVAGLIKAVMALHAQLLPPTTGVTKPHPEIGGADPALRVLSDGEAWPRKRPLRAGVSSMGFGGINVHVALEGVAGTRRGDLRPRERRLLSSAQDAELFFFGAADPASLRQTIAELLPLAPRLSRSELSDAAAAFQQRLTASEARAALVASTPSELRAGLEVLVSWLDQGDERRLDTRAGVYLGTTKQSPRIGFLFPGQGSPSHLDGGALRRRFRLARKVYENAPAPENEADEVWTAVAQPAIVTASLAGLRVLDHAGVKAAVALGHSLGELTAFHWGGALSEPAVLRIAAARGKAMAAVNGPSGAMAALGVGPEDAEALIAGAPVVIAGYNAPRLTVISGDAAAVARLVAQARARGWKATALRVSHAFHSSLVAPSAERLARHLARERFRPLSATVVSTVTGKPLASDTDLRNILGRQVTEPVRFVEALAAASTADLLVEVGPGAVLSGLAGMSVDTPVVATDAGGPSLKGMLSAIGATFALGAPVATEFLFKDRFTRPFDPSRAPKFFVNPCELAPPSGSDESAAGWREAAADWRELAEREREAKREALPTAERGAGDRPPVSPQDALAFVRALVAERAELPVDSVRDEHRLLDDLHLNSIAVGQLVVEAARQLGLAPPVAPNEFANATVSDLASAVRELPQADHPGREAGVERLPPGLEAWVRAFTVEWVERPLPPGEPAKFEDARWSIFFAPGDPLAASLSERLDPLGGGVLVCVPDEAGDETVDLLLNAAREVIRRGTKIRFVLVQRGGAAGAFARALHQEQPGITTCAVEVPADHPDAADWVAAEVRAASGYSEARYDAGGRRYEPVLRLLPPGVPRTAPVLASSDVLLVTGGGKGIAAECALDMARRTGARLALMGRSDPGSDELLASNLSRFGEHGTTFRYVQADVTDADAVRKAVREAETALGPVTAVLHGAGANVPRLIRALDGDSFRETLAPKTKGFQNVLSVVDGDRLRLVVTFGSILARIGMRGEADYAVANEWLSRLAQDFQKTHPSCRCLALEWSLWSGVGMGERLGRVESLVREGVTPITAEEGMKMLRLLLAQDLPTVPVVVTGRYGDVPTLRVERPELPLRRFLERPRVYFPGVELVAEADLSVESDPYLEEHVFDGIRLFPAVMGLEAMAQVAMALTDSARPPVFENVEFLRSVSVPNGAAVTIRLAALVRDSGRVEVAIRSAETRFQIDHFRATCRFEAPRRSDAPAESFPEDRKAVPVSLSPERDLYGGLLFQRGRFQRLRRYHDLCAKSCCAELEPNQPLDWFGPFLAQERVLDDPGVRDAALQATQACIPHARILPVGVDRLVPGRTEADAPLWVRAQERSRDGDALVYDLQLIGPDGSIRETWEGLRLKIVSSVPLCDVWSVPLLEPYLERRLQELVPGSEVRVVLEENGVSGRRSDRAIRRALGAKTGVRRRPDGKPEGDGDRTVSAAHAGSLLISVAGPDPLGCDLEPVMARDAVLWRDLLGVTRFELAEVIAAEVEEALDAAATRVWSAGECLKKGGAGAIAPLTLASSSPDGWVILASGSMMVATCVTRARGVDSQIVVAVLCRGVEAPVEAVQPRGRDAGL